MWYIQLKSLICENNQDTWIQQFSYTTDHYSLAKHTLEELQKKYSDRQFRLICIDNF
jgi:hypothetical protein